MLRRLRTWIRVVLPFELAAAVVIGLIVSFHILAYVGPRLYYSAIWRDIREPIRFTVVALTILYAVFRVAYFNPVENRRYGEWLVNSVWDSSRPLPLGPLDLVWQDVVIVATLTALFPSGGISRLIVPTAFLLVYCVGCAWSQCVHTGIYWSSFGVAFLAGCFILALFSPWGRLLAAAAMYPAVWLERQWLLGRFPFSGEGHERLEIARSTDDPSTTAGWPAPPIEREPRNYCITHVNAALVGASVAWLLFCIGNHFPDQRASREMLRAVMGYFVIGALATRIWIYANGFAPPISLLGRIATGRLIIPKYDVVFLSPLAAAAVAIVFNWTVNSVGMSAFVAVPIACGLLIGLCLALPPGREEWHFTGHHRLAFRFKAAQVDRSKSKVANAGFEPPARIVPGGGS